MADEEHGNTQISNKRIGKSVLDHFRQIFNDNEALRIKNGTILLQYLHQSSRNKNFTEVHYALQRIIRGLGGSKDSSRIGCYSTFVGFLQTCPSVSLEEVLICIRKDLQIEGGNKRSEIGNIYTGQILACGAIVRSKKFFSGDQKQQEEILQLLVNAGKSRSYLAMATVKFIAELFTMCDEEQLKRIWPVVNTEILKPWSQHNLDSLYLLLLVQKSFPNFLSGNVINKAANEIVCEENLETFCNVTLNIPTISLLKHFFYPCLAETIATSTLDLPFIALLDQQLTKYNRTKLMAVSLMFRNMLAHVNEPSRIPQFLADNFIRQILHHYKNGTNNKNDTEFHEEITNFFDCLCKYLEENSVETKIKIKVLKKLIFYPGCFMFENVTKSKNVQKIIRTLDKEGLKKLSSLYQHVLVMKREKIVAPDTTEKWLNSERYYSAQMLAKLFSSPLVQGEVEWKIKHLKVLTDMGIFKNKYDNVGMELASSIKDVLFRALDLKFNKLDDVAVVLYELIDYLKSFIVENSDALRIPLSDEDLQIFQKMHVVSTKLNAKKEGNDCALVFQVLFLHMGLQLFQDKELAVSSLNELFLCYNRVHKKQKIVNEGDPEWIEVVVDLFLNLLSHNSLLLRNIVGSVFPYLCKYLTPSSLHQILSVLDPKSESGSVLQNDSESESDEEDENEDSDENDDYDENETVNDKLRIAVQAALGQNGYHTDEESVDLDNMNEDEAKKLDKALTDAFREFKPNRGKNKKQSKQDETLTHFRIRVLDLLEIYLDSEPGMLSCLEIMLPLLQMLEFSIKDVHQKPLLIRIRHCLRKLCGVKKFISTEGINEVTLGDLLNNLLDKGTKNARLLPEMSNEISQCCIFIIKCTQMGFLQGNTKKRCQEKIIEIFTTAINTFFRQRDCLIPYYLFISMFKLNWEGNSTFASLLFSFTFDKDIRQFRRNQALDLLKNFYTNRRFDETYKNFLGVVAKHESKFCDDVIKMFDEVSQCSTNNQKIKEKFVGNLFNLLKVMSHPIKSESMDWKMLGQKIREFRSHVPLSRDAKITYNQICRILNIPPSVQMKTQVVMFSNGNDSDEEQPIKKQKTTKTKDKKEAKDRRILNMSEGLTNLSFSNLAEDVEDGCSENDLKKIRKRRKSIDLGQSTVKKIKTNLNKSSYL